MTSLDTIRRLATQQAQSAHEYLWRGKTTWAGDDRLHRGHTPNFATCPHPDCAAVRDPFAALEANWKGLNEAITANCYSGLNPLYQTASYFRAIDELLAAALRPAAEEPTNG